MTSFDSVYANGQDQSMTFYKVLPEHWQPIKSGLDNNLIQYRDQTWFFMH